MITAIEARTRSNTVLARQFEKELAPIYELIESACDKGQKVVYTGEPLDSTLCDTLKSLGYRIGQYNDPVEGWTQIAW